MAQPTNAIESIVESVPVKIKKPLTEKKRKQLQEARLRRVELQKLGGRPKGSGNVETLIKEQAKLEKEIVRHSMEQRFMRLSDSLINAQSSIALGQQFLYKIEKKWVKTGKGDTGYWRAERPVQVTTQYEIETYLEGLADAENGEHKPQDEGDTYYYITAKEPNNEALKDIQNRVFGKPKETIDQHVRHTFSLKGLHEKREAAKKIAHTDITHTLPPKTTE